MDNNKIGQNIKNLRYIFDEAQLELADAVGLDSPNAISNYEKGIRLPNEEIKMKIAAHYRTTVDELVNSDIPACKFQADTIFNNDQIESMGRFMLPVLCDDNLLKFPLFKKSFELHLRAMQQSSRDFDITTIEKCIISYSESYDTERLPEALVNSLQLLAILNVAYSSDGLEWYNYFSLIDKLESSELSKKIFLRDCADEASVSPWKNKIDIKKLNKAEFKCLSELKKFPQYNELAEWYNALRYLFGTVDNGRSFDLNHTIGDELMRNFIESDNIYSEKLKSLAIELSDEIEGTSQSVSEKDT